MEHVWVEAYVDYIPSRGAIHKQGDTWVPLDASFKQHNFTKGVDLKTAVPFDAQAFVNRLKTTATIDTVTGAVSNVSEAQIQAALTDFQTRVRNYLNTNLPNTTVEGLIGKKTVVSQAFPILPNTLPYKNVVTGSRVSVLPDSLRHKITLEVTTQDFFGPELTYTASLPELAAKRITLNYGAATSADEAVIEASAANTTIPAYLINLKPRIQVNGLVVAEGAPIKMGQDQTVVILFSGPNVSLDRIENKVTAGSYHALVLNLNKITRSMLEQGKQELQSIQTKVALRDFTDIARDDIFGNILIAIGKVYYGELDTLNNIMANQHNIAVTRLPSEIMASFLLKVNFLFNIPISAQDGGMGVDVDRNLLALFPKDGNKEQTINYLRSSGGLSSALEHAIWEQLFPQTSLEGISAVKLLKLANNQGIPIFQINKSNLASVLPNLEIDQSIKTDIANAVNTGKEVTIPKRNLTVNGWIGVGYVVFDPATGEGAYLISGGLSGGFFTLLSAFFSSLADWVSTTHDKGYIPKSNTVQLASKISNFLTLLGFTITVVDIVSNPNLSEAQKVAEILTWLGATIVMLKAGAFIAATLFPVVGLIAITALYVVITYLTLLLIDLIERQALVIRRYWAYT